MWKETLEKIKMMLSSLFMICGIRTEPQQSTKVLTEQHIWSILVSDLNISAWIAEKRQSFRLVLDKEAVTALKLDDGSYLLEEQLGADKKLKLLVEHGFGYIDMELSELESLILKVKNRF